MKTVKRSVKISIGDSASRNYSVISPLKHEHPADLCLNVNWHSDDVRRFKTFLPVLQNVGSLSSVDFCTGVN